MLSLHSVLVRFATDEKLLCLLPEYDNHGYVSARDYQHWHSTFTDACFRQPRLKFDADAQKW